MRLKHIKLAGFKSFVDPTKIAFPEQMTCIVGPNGCGKSNVIDAVRWVLGESSAKNLRGDAMTDVIFNGSQSRKPVSQASVELVFDNTSGRVQGEFASFNEISVKRIVTRDGQSIYMLNGSKCRRRDITDLFLGTGLGPRSYAIIEQGMISRLIESRPQELRVFIEEAAGISRYKERRKETESRMNRTRDNLDRLTDVREELGTQLAKLQRQAAAAKRYQTLKAEERELRAQLQALRWNQYQQQCDRLELKVQTEEAELQKWVAEQRGSERGQTELREQEAELKQRVDTEQQQFYRVNTEITKLEQQIQHTRQLHQQRQRQRDELSAQIAQLQEQANSDQLEHAELLAQQEELQDAHELAREQQAMAEVARDDAEHAYHEWQEQSQRIREQMNEQQQKISIAEADERAIHDLLQRLQARLQVVGAELADLPTADSSSIEALQQVVQQAANDLQEQQQYLSALEAEHRQLIEQQQAGNTRLANSQQQMQQHSGRIAALEQLLASRSSTNNSAESEQGLSEFGSVLGTLRELLQVPEQWRSAVEAVLLPWLHLPVLDRAKNDAAASTLALPTDVAGLTLRVSASTAQAAPLSTSLAAQQSATQQVSGAQEQGPGLTKLPLLEQILLADDHAEAEQWLHEHTHVFAVAVANGGVVGRGWQLQAIAAEDSELAWQQQLQELQVLEQAAQAAVAEQQQELQRVVAALEEQEQRIVNQREATAAAREQLVRQQERSEAQQRELQQHNARMEKLSAEQLELNEQLEQQEERLLLVAEQLADAREQKAEFAPLQEQQQQAGEQFAAVRQQSQRELQACQQRVHEAQLQLSQLQSRLQHLQQVQERNQLQQQSLTQRLDELAIDDEDSSTDELEETLAQQLMIREEVEVVLTDLREQLAGVSEQLAILNQGQGAVLEQIARQQERVQAEKMELAAARERGHALLDALQEMNVSLKSVLATMPEDAEEKRWQQRLDDTSRKVQQLGAINLAALEEVEVQAERKAYLDAQHEDLMASLTTLEDAIKKIDRETRQRFKATYDQVNLDLQRLFPKVFGGGQAYLDLTGDDLLETGVTIMARPPGKKNSTIHLLSGGEKALTALALVFAIFRLNPAPFCLLDEVDAPLDDVNVGRFCRLVQEMSESVQFIYISHNKIAMEMATHLAGVTMQEPGVSRLVAVDVEEALALADA
ncbi:MAG: chromosome segregation protein SMC [Idiomarina sp.]|nr:chromosome segregation protein SMC [Idiomarina sp.]